MSEKNTEELQSVLNSLKEGYAQKVLSSWVETINTLEGVEDNSLHSEDLLELLTNTKSYRINSTVETELQFLFSNLELEAKEGIKLIWQFNLNNPEMRILSNVSTGVNRFVELMNAEGNTQIPPKLDNLFWNLIGDLKTHHGKHIFSKFERENLEKDGRKSENSEYLKMRTKGLGNWLIEETMKTAFSDIKHCENSLIKSGVITKKNPNLRNEFFEKLKIIVDLINKKLIHIESEDGEL